MSATGQQIVDRVGSLVQDVRHHKHSKVAKLYEINAVIKDKFAGKMRPYTRTHSFSLKNDIDTYTYPIDMLHIIDMTFEGYLGSDEVLAYDRDQFSSKMAYHDITSNNQFRLDPIPTVENYAESTTWYTDDLPDAADAGATWQDRDGYILFCTESYGAADAELIVITRPDANLVFTAVSSGTSFINIVLSRGGATGTASMAMTGTGVYNDPYVYTFTLYDNNNSNDDMITLLYGDPYLTAAGASSVDETTVTEVGSTPLVNGNADYWENFRIDVNYKADVPILYNLTDTLNPCIKTPLDNGEAIAHFAAANILKRARRPNVKKIELYRNDGQGMLDTAHGLVNRNKRRKPMRMTPGY